jgi:Uma2 family endonuclease
MSALAQAFITPQEYLERERQADFKSEYWNGEVFAMTGATRAHNQIVSNIIAALGTQLRDKPCSVYPSDMKVKTESLKKYTYPDVTVSCDPEVFDDEHKDILLNPLVLIEVLSDSTEAYDRGLKFFHYQAIECFQEYLLVSQKFCQVEQFVRQADNTWMYREYHAMGDVLALNTIRCSLALADVYRRVVF